MGIAWVLPLTLSLLAVTAGHGIHTAQWLLGTLDVNKVFCFLKKKPHLVDKTTFHRSTLAFWPSLFTTGMKL
jgi:hypothetical protein